MPEISLTDFVDFVIKAGGPKLTKVREIISRPDYSPACDYWKAAREHIADFQRGKVKLGLTPQDPKKRLRYDAAFAGYAKFLKELGEEVEWFDPPSERWTSSGLTVRVNPELGLRIKDRRHIIKLYFKDEEPTKHRLQAVLEMMRIALRKPPYEDVLLAVLDVANGKLRILTREELGFRILLVAEAESFMRMWRELNSAETPAVNATHAS